ncbi:MAG: hypothetical protein K2Q24_17575 [Chitinophagaceae bacterium]|jgi:hypothetical protein|nr:hypothetical protein [Chitinophagaceae bacterium]
MNKSRIILITAFSILFFNATYAQKYFGKSYSSTQVVDEYYDSANIKKAYTIMGQTELAQGFRSLEKCQQNIIRLAKKKGADGVIFSIEEDVYGTSNSNNGSISNEKKNKTTISSSGSTVNLKQKKVRALFIKYD